MADPPDTEDAEPKWEKPDFEVTPLADIEERPGFDDGEDPES